MNLTLGSLFDGLGGWQIAAVRAGVKPIWSSEIEKFPLALTKVRFPNTKQLGDVTKIDGTKIEAPDILTAGSPCQNLSVAGNREGLKGEQSGLFRDSIRLIRQLRMSTKGGQPRFFVWENVPGAFTSGSERGADFRAVLESIAETDIPMPKDGRWAAAGMVQCPKCEIAWRTLDAQFWGVPQRRKRIFLVADFAATDRRAGKILFVEPSLSGNTEQSRETRKRVASTIEKSIRTASELVHRGGTSVVKIRSGRDDGTAGKGALIGIEQSFTLGTGNDQTLFQEKLTSTVGGQNESTLYENHAQDYRVKQVNVSPTVGTRPTTNPTLVMENIPKYVIMGHDERSARFHTETTDPLTACDYKQPPIVAQMSTTGGQMCWSASKADHMAKFSKNIAGALMATDWKDAPVLVTENKQLEVCAPMTDEDSTDKM